jgi:hypothetical protein
MFQKQLIIRRSPAVFLPLARCAQTAHSTVIIQQDMSREQRPSQPFFNCTRLVAREACVHQRRVVSLEV